MMHKAFGAAAVFLACSAAHAAEKYEFKTEVPVGRTTHFAEVRVETMKLQTQLDGDVVEKKDVTERTVRSGTDTVLTVTDGAPTAVKIAFDDACGSTTTSPGQNAKQEKSPFAGKTVTLRRKPTDTVSDDFGGSATAEEIKDLHSLLDPDADDFPDRAVSVGESWETTAKVSRRLDLGRGDKMLAFCRLDWVKDVGGRKTAQLSVSAAFLKHFEGFVEEQVEMTGHEWVDMETGTVVRADVKGNVKLAGSSTTNAAGGKSALTVSGSGTIENSGSNGPEGWATTRPEVNAGIPE